MTWLEEIVQAFQSLGGTTSLTQLYSHIEQTTERQLAKNWKAVVRSIIEDNSSDAAFRAKRDLFYSVGGKGSGIWGLRSSPEQTAFRYLAADAMVIPEEIISNRHYYEGATKQITVNVYERSSVARKACLKHYGLNCIICNFNFEQVYGKIGQGFIHVHHLRPLSEIGEAYKLDAIEDLRPICANCHAIVHRRTPPYSIDEVREMLLRSG